MDKIAELQDLADRHFQAVNAQIANTKNHHNKNDKQVATEFAHMLVFIQSELRITARIANAGDMRARIVALTETVRRMGLELTGCKL